MVTDNERNHYYKVSDLFLKAFEPDENGSSSLRLTVKILLPGHILLYSDELLTTLHTHDC